ncbi:Protein N-acetyltransferase, RimJ/RimL family [Amycolatopsis arida]|uniref:Protein N-acetyltransferase, RimJ/RimL family n=1 Tax=Amycolatopsis arida TaxID=587909 RepID=A0A1I5WQA4_9PSEU|nr:GNAT family N-acetyltransferase [Amycolatopsis arida]TDX92388.1 RimJ/RimL family protein N-acetyltransferase [Amycolatopsis arida]SFQ21761.1 Protein N-acetyltransferase, RimJ/RimL family [Amycolatopsis arida]
MEPVEINAGTCYLRQLRADDRLDDRAALVEAFADPWHRRYIPDYQVNDLGQAGEYVALRARQWARDERCSWAIAEPTTGGLLGEVVLKNLDLPGATAEAGVWVHPVARGRGVATIAVGAALRFGFGALGLRTVTYQHAESNKASAAVARRCGFRLLRAEDINTGERELIWSRGPGEA